MVQEGGSWNVPWAPFLPQARNKHCCFCSFKMLNVEGVELLDNSVACFVHQCGSVKVDCNLGRPSFMHAARRGMLTCTCHTFMAHIFLARFELPWLPCV